ncbi:MAG: pentapeptide repeat-containing protein [Bacteroidetes bacterium]|nr:MAG: pentapeptide repeat-containing protein [Bacteroidota bacterium]
MAVRSAGASSVRRTGARCCLSRSGKDARSSGPSGGRCKVILQKILEDHKKWLAGKGGERAVLSEACLNRADLSGACLIGADLSGADLSGADLSGARLIGADLGGADLNRADLSGADLSWADLRGACLSGAKFLECKTEIWTIQVHADSVRIGCQHHSHEEWMAFSDEEIAKMDDRALDWWRRYKPVVAAMIEAVKQQGGDDD